MGAQIIDGKAISANLITSVKGAVEARLASGKSAPGLAVVLVGDNPASQAYVRNKIRACKQAGIISFEKHFEADISQEALEAHIEALNQDEQVHGILVQLPLPPHLESYRLIDHIAPQKDVDGFHPYNMGRLALRRPLLRPCTPFGIIKLLNSINYNFKSGQMTIVGASNIVGRPLTLECLIAGATPTTAHRFTEDLPTVVSRADCLVVAIGKPGIIQSKWIKPGAVVIDVGINRVDGKLRGDIDFDSAKERAGWITPVPGGVGPMTVATLLENTLMAANLQESQ